MLSIGQRISLKRKYILQVLNESVLRALQYGVMVTTKDYEGNSQIIFR